MTSDNSIPGQGLLEVLPVPIYLTDPAGRITFYNEAAAELWGHRPELGSAMVRYMAALLSDGSPMRHDECPMAVMLQGRPAVPGIEAIAERPDGSRVPFMPFPSSLRMVRSGYRCGQPAG